MSVLVLAYSDIHVGGATKVDAYSILQALAQSAESKHTDSDPKCITMRRESRVHGFLDVSAHPSTHPANGGPYGLLWHQHAVGQRALFDAAGSVMRAAGIGPGFWKGATEDACIIRVLHNRERRDPSVPPGFVRLALSVVAGSGRGIPESPHASELRRAA